MHLDVWLADTSSSARVAIVEFKIHYLEVQKVNNFRPTCLKLSQHIIFNADDYSMQYICFFSQMLGDDYSMQSLQILNFDF